MSRLIDLRSDTVTTPTKKMMAAIAEAKLGDDGYGEDPSLKNLEEKSAEIIGKEAALFLPSGTMGNLVAVMTHAQQRKSEIIAEFYSHILNSEAAGYSHLAGVAARGIKGKNGFMDPEEVEACIRTPGVIHQPRTSLICVENSHNYYGGTVIGIAQQNALKEVADRHGIPMHLDGARIFNAAAALHVHAKDIAAPFSSVMFCLSKGLSAPAGSILAGDRAFIQEARLYRKMLGGGMRQAGVLAAAGTIALTEMSGRLEEDHAHAKALASGLWQLDGICVDLAATQTNIVRVDTAGTGKTAAELAHSLKEEGVLCNATGPYILRFVTHRHITVSDIEATLAAFEKVLARPSQKTDLHGTDTVY